MDKNKHIVAAVAAGIVIATIVLIVVLVVFSGDDDTSQDSNQTETNNTDSSSGGTSNSDIGQGITISDQEVMVTTITPGQGDAVARYGDRITVDYEGRLNDENGAVFDSSYERGIPFDFVLGQGSVIDGWEQGLLNTKVGQVLTLTIPPELGYGSRAVGEDIPANSTLFFRVEVLDIAPSK